MHSKKKQLLSISMLDAHRHRHRTILEVAVTARMQSARPARPLFLLCPLGARQKNVFRIKISTLYVKNEDKYYDVMSRDLQAHHVICHARKNVFTLNIGPICVNNEDIYLKIINFPHPKCLQSSVFIVNRPKVTTSGT